MTTVENKDITAPEKELDVKPAEILAADDVQSADCAEDMAVPATASEHADAAPAEDPLTSVEEVTSPADDVATSELETPVTEKAADDVQPEDENLPQGSEYVEDETPAFSDENIDADEFRPDDVSEDGSPHGPLDLFEEEEEKKAEDFENDEFYDETNVPTFASFHSPSVDEDEEEEEEEEDEEDEEEAPMTLMGHLNELRRRLFRIVIIVILGFVAFYGVAEPLYGFLSEPLKIQLPEGSKLIYTSPAGAFFTYMKVALVASLFGTSPFSFYQLWAFIAPGLYKEEKQAILPLAFFSSIFFMAGAAFCFFLVFPIAFKFFMGFATDTIVPMISVEEYLGFALKLLIAFGVVFEMPLFAYFLSRFGLLTPDFMRRQRRYAILLIFIMAAILTPPDVFSQCLMAMPMLLLYEVSIYVSAVAYKKKEDKKDTDSEEKEEAEEESKEETA